MKVSRVVAEDVGVLLAAAGVGLWTAFLTTVTCPGGAHAMCNALPVPRYGPGVAALFAFVSLASAAFAVGFFDREFGRLNREAIRWLHSGIHADPERSSN